MLLPRVGLAPTGIGAPPPGSRHEPVLTCHSREGRRERETANSLRGRTTWGPRAPQVHICCEAACAAPGQRRQQVAVDRVISDRHPASRQVTPHTAECFNSAFIVFFTWASSQNINADSHRPGKTLLNKPATHVLLTRVFPWKIDERSAERFSSRS